MNHISAPDQIIEIVSEHQLVKVMLNKLTGQKSLQASAHFRKDDIICKFSAKTTEAHPTYLTIQTGEDRHITLSPEFLQYTNHSCDPNVFFDTSSMELICLREIVPGDELAYFYPSTEWEMDQPFECQCGSDSCLHFIQGAKYLSLQERERYNFSEFITRKMNQDLFT